ncbi:hypothetical protein IVB40_07650 [Bradyrhizobium sp. 40]|uniref:hypothetical protein n=1 Tax=Bradyrhizobium sp. 40 TaxID=2782674 RepID=UPI001FFFC341|nr:hypothetical protein [Bradyrhizobium sp. 40]UPJ43934.1 hypothetical protein IVB40_07650 [Bradyrhizobium sp. 40]
MSLDLFNPLPALQNAQSNLAPDLPAEFSEAFDVSTRSMTEWNSSVNYQNARERALATYYDDIKAQTGVQLPLYGMGGGVSLEELNDGIAKLPRPLEGAGQSWRPLSESDIDAMALLRMRKAHEDAAAFGHRETTWGGTLGTITGTLAAGVSDPVAIASLPLGGAGQAGIAFRALEFALIGGGTEAAIAGAGASARAAAVPGSLREIPGEIASAALFGGIFGAGIGGLQKLAGTGARTLPVTVRDEVHAATSEAQLNLSNPFPTAAGEAAARDAAVDATRSAVRGEPVRAGEGFDATHVADYAASLSPDYKLATSAVPLNPENSIVFVDADKLDAMLGPMNRTYSADKRTGAKEFLASEPENWNPPEISARVNKRHGGDIVDIVDGQHRWAAMRDREMPVVPVEMDAASARKAKDLGLVVDRPQPADYALAAKSQTPEELAIAGEKHLRPETYGLEPEVERFDRMPSEADDVASYWDKRLEAATPEERAALGATDEDVVALPRDVSARDLTPEEMSTLDADPKTFDAAVHDLDHVLAANPDAEFTTQTRLPDGTYQFTTQKLSDVLGELNEFERAAKELEACVIGLEAAE